MIFKMNDPHLTISYANRDRFVFVNLVEKEDKNKLFDCTIIQDLCYTLSNYKQIVQIYKETET